MRVTSLHCYALRVLLARAHASPVTPTRDNQCVIPRRAGFRGVEVSQPAFSRARARPSRASAFALLATLATLALSIAAPPASPAARFASHFEFTLHGAAATPLWWSPGFGLHVDEVTRYDVDIPAGVLVRVLARASLPGGGVHLYAFDAGDGTVPPYALQDLLPGGVKSLSLPGPARLTVLVDASASGPYEIVATFDGFVGATSGARAPFHLNALGSYACPLAPVGACPP